MKFKVIFFGVLVSWLLINLAPFLIFGEYWGMLWMKLNYPLSYILEDVIGIGRDSYFLILSITVIQGALISAIICLVKKFVFGVKGFDE